MADLENIDGYVSKDSLYRLLSTYRMTNILTDREASIVESRKAAEMLQAMKELL